MKITDLLQETLTIVDVNGKIILTVRFNTKSVIIDTRQWPKGIYFVSCKNRTHSILKK